MSHTSYMYEIFEPAAFHDRLLRAKRWLKKHPEVKAIAGRGVSGISFAAGLCAMTSLALIAVRKPGDDSHSEHRGCETPEVYAATKYVIVDDLISTGDTIRIIVEKIHDESYYLEPAAILLYHRGAEGCTKKKEIDGIPVTYLTRF